MARAHERRTPALLYLNGRLVEPAEARISALDRGFLYGDGFFETLRIVRGVPFRLARHLERLAASCLAAGFAHELEVDGLAAALMRLVETNGVEDGYLRVSVSRGERSGRLEELACREPTVLAEAREMDLPPLESPPSIVLGKSPYLRNGLSPTVRHKSLSYQQNLLALAEGRARGADEVFFVNQDGFLTEGAISNLFFVCEGTVFTPEPGCGLLPGITRAAVLELCAREGVPAEEGSYGEERLRSADEVFCTNSLRGIMRVERILDWPKLDLSRHELIRRLQQAYAAMVRAECGGHRL